jgi:hypothetical protein
MSARAGSYHARPSARNRARDFHAVRPAHAAVAAHTPIIAHCQTAAGTLTEQEQRNV